MNFEGQVLPQHGDEFNYEFSRKSPIKIVIIFIIGLICVLIVSISGIVFIVSKKTKIQDVPTTSSTNHSDLQTSTTRVVTSTSLIPENITKTNGCSLPLYPRYSTNKIIVAGNESRGSTIYELDKPLTVVVDSRHNFYVFDSGNRRVLKYTPNSQIGQVVIGNGIERYPTMDNFLGLAIDKNDILYTYHEDSKRYNHVIVWPSSLLENGTELLVQFGRFSSFNIDKDLNVYFASGVNLWIYLAPTYKESIMKRVFGEREISGTLPTGTANTYIDSKLNYFAIDMEYFRVQRMAKDSRYADTVMQVKPSPLAIVGDCNGNLYTIDSQASLIIYNSTGYAINTIQNILDNPRTSSAWEHTYMAGENDDYIADYFASIALDLNNGDLYVIMYGYNRVAKYTLI
ncbi:hypothetical protein I4U23_012321 [Adineta vaga]|nr:hypothetical protein I4U23_012321 [Adineta vaga]